MMHSRQRSPLPTLRCWRSLCLSTLALAACASAHDGGTSGLPTGAAGGGAGGLVRMTNAGAPSGLGGVTALGGMAEAADAGRNTAGNSGVGSGGDVGGGLTGATAGAGNSSAGAAPTGGSGGRASGGGSAGMQTAGGSPAGCPVAFCEDFESGSFNPGSWSTNISGQGNTATVQKGISAHGSWAAAFHYAGTRNTWAFALVKALPLALKTHHFGRANVLLQPGLPDRHTEILSAGGPGFPKSKYLEIAGVGASFQLTYVDLVGGGEDYKAGGTVPGARWFCMEWEFNDAPDETKLFVDGTQVAAVSPFTLNGTSTGLIGGFSEFGIGYRVWGAGAVDTPKDYYFDDVALGAARVGCLPK